MVSANPKNIALFLFLIALCPFLVLGQLSAQQTAEIEQSHANTVATLIAKPLFELDPEQIQTIVENYVANVPEILGVSISENLENEVLLSAFRDESGQILSGQSIPAPILGLPKFTAEVFFREENVGRVDLYVKQASPLDLTPEEINWIRNNPEITVGIEEWYPFVRYNPQSGFAGVAADFLAIVLDRTGLRFKPVPNTWSNLLSDFRDGKIDLLPATYFTQERSQYGLYSQPYFTGREFIYTKGDNNEIRSFDDLNGKRLALPADFGTIPKIREKFPDIEIVETSSTLRSIYYVLDGRADATFEQQIVMEQLLQQELITGIKPVPQSYFNASELHFFSNQNKPVLASILSKALASISDEERSQILKKWLGNRSVVSSRPTEEKSDLKILLIVTGITLGLIVLLGLVRELIKRLSNRDVTKAYESREVKGTGLLFVSGFLAIVIFAAWLTAENAEQEKRDTAGLQLQTVLNATHEAIQTWFNSEKRDIVRIASDPFLMNSVKQLLGEAQSSQTLDKSVALSLIRQWMKDKLNNTSIKGFSIISPDRVIRASNLDEELGATSLIHRNREFRMNKVFTGRTKLIPPIFNNVISSNENNPVKRTASLYIATPIYNENSQVIAALALKYNPSEDFTRIAQIGRIGASGETYLIDRQATLITNSRFDEDLQAIGLLASGQSAILNLDVRDPGTNLLETRQIPSNMSELPLTLMAQNVIDKNNGHNTDGYRDYRGVTVLGAWLWNEELGFGITTEIDEDEFLATFYRLRLMMAIILSITVVVALTLTGLSVWIGQSANRSLRQARDNLEEQIAERTRELNFQKFALDKHAIVSATDADGRITYVNDQFLKTTGYKREELMNRNHRILKSGYHDSSFYEEMWATIASGNVWHGELCNRNKDGSPLWLAASIIPFTDEDGKPEHYISIRTDITERKHAEQQAKDNEARIKALIENAVDGIIVIDANAVIQSFSPAAERIFGYSEREVLDKNVKILMPPHTASEHDSYITDYLGGNPHNVVNNNREVVGLRKDGSTFPMDLAVGESIIEGEHIFTGIVRDISDRKKAEEELESNRNQLSDILSNIMQGVVLFDENRKLVTWNKHYPTIIQLDEELLVPGMDIYDIALILAARNQYHNEGDATEIAKKRVEYLWAESNRMDISYGDDRIFDSHNIKTKDGRLVITYTDISQRKKNEEIIASSMKLIQESISYASRIQRSVLPTQKEFETVFADHFLIWEPKDIVGGDICLMREIPSGTLLTVVDCTGHGVPGAFMTMVVTGALDQALIELPDADPAILLTRLNQLVKTVLSQTGDASESDDGFECGMCLINSSMGMLLFAGARFELWQINENDPNTVKVIKGDKSGVGYCSTPFEQSFELHNLSISSNDTFYMTSDGLVDQVGGDRKRGFGKKRLKEALLQSSTLKLEKQKETILSVFNQYQANEARRDDISMVGFKLLQENQIEFNI